MTSSKSTWRFRLRLSHIFFLIWGVIIMGCAAAPERRHPDYQTHLAPIRSVLCLAPEFGVFNVSGFNHIRQEAQSRSAGEQIKTAVTRTLSEKGFAVTLAEEHTLNHPEVRSLTALFRAVNRSIQLHTYGPQIYPGKQAAFDYSLGPIKNLLDANGADALVLAIGRQTISQTASRTWLSIALVEPHGKIIWYALNGTTEDLQALNADHAKTLVSEALSGLSEGASS